MNGTHFFSHDWTIFDRLSRYRAGHKTTANCLRTPVFDHVSSAFAILSSLNRCFWLKYSFFDQKLAVLTKMPFWHVYAGSALWTSV